MALVSFRVIATLLAFAGTALGADAELELASRAHDAAGDGAGAVSWIVGGLMALVLIAAVTSAVGKSPRDHFLGFLAYLAEGRAVDHLYLPCWLGGRDARILSLSLRAATVLSAQPLRRGEQVRLTLGDGCEIEARVRHVSRVDGTWHVGLRLRRLTDRQRDRVRALLLALAGGQGWLPGSEGSGVEQAKGRARLAWRQV